MKIEYFKWDFHGVSGKCPTRFREICWSDPPPGATLAAMNVKRREGNRLGHAAGILLSVLGVLLAGCQRPAEKAAAPEPEAPPASSGEVAEIPPPAPTRFPMPEPAGPWQGFGEPGAGRISVTVGGDIEHPGQYFLDEGANLESVYQACGGSGGHGDFGGMPPQRVIVNRKGKVTTYAMTQMTTEARAAVKLADGDILTYPEIMF